MFFLYFVNRYLDDNLKRNFFFEIQRQLPPESVSEYMRKIGLSESDYHYSSTSKHSDDHRPYKMLDKWTQRCGNWLTGCAFCRTNSVLV